MNTRMIGILVLAGMALAAEAQKPRIALLLSEGGQHHDEFDNALSTLGWSADRYPCKTDAMQTLAGKLGDYDMLLVAPLTHGARGIIWYPWNQMGGGPIGVGLKNSPEQQGVVSQLCSEVTALLPVLFAPERQPFASADGKLQCLYCRANKQRAVLMVNSTPEKLEAEARLPVVFRMEKTNAEMKDYFKKRTDSVEVKDGRFRVALEPYETRAYSW